MSRRPELRFLEKYTPEPNTGCWLWLGHVDPDGYGLASSALYPESTRAHRVFYRHFKGPIPDGMLLCHQCDVRSCVNPDHLFLGTAADNHLDMERKGRGPMSSRKHSREAVSQMRSDYDNGVELAVVARRYGATWETARKIVNRLTYRDIS